MIHSGKRTVLFVSHSMKTVREIADQVLWIDASSVRQQGTPDDVCVAYEQFMYRGDVSQE